ncbi:MAG: ATP synthase F0 subunit B, partial [bacterium]|nr:ATP synthase F0 subunit B [bacterium]
FIFRPTLRLFEERKKRTEGEQERAAALDEKAARTIQQVEQHLSQAREEGMGQKEKRLKEAYAFRNQVVQKMREEGQKRLQEVQARVEKEGQEAMKTLRRDVEKIGQQIAEKFLERPL